MTIKSVSEINEYVRTSVNPLATPDQLFELYSVPSFDSDYPEIVSGAEIGSAKVTVEEGDVLICKINPRINRVWVVRHNTDYPLLASSEWIVVRSKNMNPHYLKWYFSSSSFRTLLTSQVTGIGGSLTRAQPKQVAKYPVPVPSRAEQDYIAGVLERIDELLLKQHQQTEKLDELVKSILAVHAYGIFPIPRGCSQQHDRQRRPTQSSCHLLGELPRFCASTGTAGAVCRLRRPDRQIKIGSTARTQRAGNSQKIPDATILWLRKAGAGWWYTTADEVYHYEKSIDC